MMENFRKSFRNGLILVCGALACMTTTAAHAEYYSSYGGGGDCCQSDCCDEGGFYGGADFLYWNAYKADQDYAVQNLDTFDVGRGDTKGTLYFAESEWSPGFRLFGGYRNPCDCWELGVVYTWWQSNNSVRASFGDAEEASPAEHLKPTLWSPSFGNDRCQSASAKYNIEYQVLDVLISSPYNTGCCNLTAQPFFGFRALKLDQRLNVNYTGGRDFSIIPGVVKWTSDFWAYGLHAGSNWNIELCDGFSLCAGFAGSILAGDTNDCENQSGPEGTGPGSPAQDLQNNINVKEQQCIGLPGYHITAGFCYDTCYCDCYYASFGIGYEFNHWLNVPNIRRYTSTGQESANNAGGSNGCLLLHGLTLRAEVSF